MVKANLSTSYSIIFDSFQSQDYRADEEKFKQAKLNNLDPITEDQLRDFATKYPITEEFGKFLFGENFQPVNNDQFNKVVETHFDNLKGQYGFPDEVLNFNNYLKCYKACLLTAEMIENNNTGTEVASRAFLMHLLFDGDLKAAETAINGNYQVQNPVHDALMHGIPKYQEGAIKLDVAGWRALVKMKGISAKDVIENFVSAIELQPNEKAAESKKEFKDAQEVLLKKSFVRAEENIELAKLCKLYKVDEKIFNECLDLMKDGIIHDKTADAIPDIIVDIGKIEGLKEKDGYYLVKLPSGDLRAMILGEITDCCQYIGGHSEECVIDGITRENNGFYVLLKGKKGFNQKKIDWENLEEYAKIEGQGYVWRSQSDATLTFDSWENLKNESNDQMMFKVLQQFGKQVSEGPYGVERVTIGIGGKTPEYIKKMTTCYVDAMKEGYNYRDSEIQVEVFVSNRLEEVRKKLAEKTKVDDQSSIISVEHGGQVSSLLDKEDIFSGKLKSYYSFYSGFRVVEFAKTFSLGDEFFGQQDVHEIRVLVSSDARQVYKECNLKPDDFNGLDVHEIRVLLSSDARQVYKECNLKPYDFKGFDANKIKELLSSDAMQVYEKCNLKPDDFKGFDVHEIRVLVSSDAMEVYKEYNLKPDDFNGFDANKIKELLSSDARQVYEKCNLKPYDFKGFDVDEIRVLLSFDAEQVYKECNLKPYDFKGFGANKIKELTSNSARQVYKKFNLRPYDFKGFDVDKIKVLTSDSASQVYKKFNLKPDDFKGFDVYKIKALTSYDAMEVYKEYNLKPDDFKGFDANKIYALILGMEVYKEYNLKPDDFKGFDANKIYALTSYDARQVYKKFNLKPDDFKGFDVDKIKVLTSYDARQVYEKCNLRPNDFKGFDAKQIEALLSYDAAYTYIKCNLRPDDFKGFDVDEIKVLLSSGAMEVYKEYNLRPDDFKGFDANKIYALTSYDARQVYGKHNLTPLDFIDNNKYDVTDSEAAALSANKGAFFEELKLHAKVLSHDAKSGDIVDYTKNHIKGNLFAERNHDFFVELCRVADSDADAESIWQTIANSKDQKGLVDKCEDLIWEYMKNHDNHLPDID